MAEIGDKIKSIADGLAKADAGVLALTKSIVELQRVTESAKGVDSLVASVTKLNAIQKDVASTQQNQTQLQKQLAGETQKLANVQSEEGKELIKKKIAVQEANKAVKEQIKTEKLAKQNIDKLISGVNQLTASESELEKQNKALVATRKGLTRGTKEGEEQAAKLNERIDSNSKLLKTNSSEVEQQRQNIGNYASALDGAEGALGALPGPLGGVVNGIKGVTKSALAFIATPIGAVIAAIGLALGALTSFLTGTERGQDKLNKITKIFGVILGNIMEVVIAVGEAIFNAFASPKESINALVDIIKKNLLTRLEGLVDFLPLLGRLLKDVFTLNFSGASDTAKDLADSIVKISVGADIETLANSVGSVTDAMAGLVDETNREIASQAELADRGAKLNKDQRAFLIDQANARVLIADLILKSRDIENLSAEERLAGIKEAQVAQEELTEERIRLAKESLDIAQAEAEFGENTREDNDKLAEQEAALIALRKEGADKIRALVNREITLRNEVRTTNTKATQEALKLQDEESKSRTAALEKSLVERKTVLNQGLRDLEKQLLDGKISVEAFEKARIESQKKANIALLKSNKEFLQASGDAELKALQASIDATKDNDALKIGLQKQFNALSESLSLELLKLDKSIKDEEVANFIDAEKKKLDAKKESDKKLQDTAKEDKKKGDERRTLIERVSAESANTIFSIQKARIEAETSLVDNEIAEISRAQEARNEDIEILLAEQEERRASGQELTEDASRRLVDLQADKVKFDKIDAKRIKELEDRRRKLAIEKFNSDKASALVDIAINTAVGVSKALSRSDFISAGLITTAGIVQAGVVLAKDPPKFAKGSDNAPKGLAVVGEKGRELVVPKKGTPYLTRDSAHMVNLSGGEQIFTKAETDAMFLGRPISSVGDTNITLDNAELLASIDSLGVNMKRIAKRPIHNIVNIKAPTGFDRYRI